MPKGTKLTQLPKLEEWKAPWEVTRDAEGNETPIPEDEQKIDQAQLKKYLYGLLNDKINIRNSLDDVTAEAEELRTRVESASKPEEITALQEELATARKERDAAAEKARGSAGALKWEIALEKGLSKTQAKRLVGSTREELEADADELIAEFGHRGSGAPEEGDNGVRRAPRRRLQHGGDPDDGAGGGDDDKPLDHAEIVRQALAAR